MIIINKKWVLWSFSSSLFILPSSHCLLHATLKMKMLFTVMEFFYIANFSLCVKFLFLPVPHSHFFITMSISHQIFSSPLFPNVKPHPLVFNATFFTYTLGEEEKMLVSAVFIWKMGWKISSCCCSLFFIIKSICKSLYLAEWCWQYTN